MAEDTIRKMKDSLNCSICLDIYTDPKQLQCNHVFCQNCLQRLVVTWNPFHLTCPTCRQNTPLPANGVVDLPSAFQIVHFLQILDEHKKASMSPVAAQGWAVPLSPASKQIPCCSVHHGKELEFYCETCGELICYKCALKNGKHRDHDYKEINESFELYVKEITSIMTPMKQKHLAAQKALAELDKRSGEIINQQGAVETKINDAARKLCDNIETRRAELSRQLHGIAEKKLEDLEAQRNKIKVIESKFSDCLASMTQSFKTANKGEVLKKKPATIQQAQQLTSAFQPDTLKPTVEADVQFSASTDICAVHGQLVQCHATGEGLERAVVGNCSTVTVHATSFSGGECEDLTKSLECELVSERQGTRNVLVANRAGAQGQYRVSYTPSTDGNHHLRIKVAGLPIVGSPFNVAVTKSLCTQYTPWRSSQFRSRPPPPRGRLPPAPQLPTNAPQLPTNAPQLPTNAPQLPTNAPQLPTNAPQLPTNAPQSQPTYPGCFNPAPADEWDGSDDSAPADEWDGSDDSDDWELYN